MEVPLSGVPSADFRISVILFTLIPAHLFVSLWIETWAAHKAKKIKARENGSKNRRKESWGLIRFTHIVNVSICLGVTSVTVYTKVYHPLLGIVCELHAGTHPFRDASNGSDCCVEGCVVCVDESRFEGYVP